VSSASPASVGVVGAVALAPSTATGSSPPPPPPAAPAASPRPASPAAIAIHDGELAGSLAATTLVGSVASPSVDPWSRNEPSDSAASGALSLVIDSAAGASGAADLQRAVATRPARAEEVRQLELALVGQAAHEQRVVDAQHAQRRRHAARVGQREPELVGRRDHDAGAARAQRELAAGAAFGNDRESRIHRRG
jgi:hypothetical protein